VLEFQPQALAPVFPCATAANAERLTLNLGVDKALDIRSGVFALPTPARLPVIGHGREPVDFPASVGDIGFREQAVKANLKDCREMGNFTHCEGSRLSPYC